MLSAREQAAVAHASGEEVFFARRTLDRGRADLRRRYAAPTFAEALRRHQLSTDEQTARIDKLEGMVKDLGRMIERVSSSGNSSNGQREVERQVRRIEDEFSDDELQMVREHRAYESFKRNVERYGQELEREAALARSSDDDDDDDDEDDDVDEDDDTEGEKPKPKAKTKAKPAPRKPASRHKADDDDGGDKPEPEGLLARLMKD